MATSAHSSNGQRVALPNTDDFLADSVFSLERTAGSTSRMDVCCAGCGYGAVVESMPPQCPMCSGTTWDFAAWRPLTSARLEI